MIYSRVTVMRIKLLFFIFLTLLFATGSEAGGNALIDDAVINGLSENEKIRVLIKLMSSTDDPSISRTATSKDVNSFISKSDIKRLQSDLESFFFPEELQNEINIVHKLDVIPWITAEITQIGLDKLKTNPNVAMIVADKEVYISLSQSAPLINAYETHSILGYTGSGISVAVIDTGIDTDHPDLQDDLIHEECFLNDASCPNGGGIRASGAGSAEDGHGHGTHVAGIITSSDSTHKGIAPDANIVALKTMNNNGSGWSSDIIAAMDWAVSNKDAYGIGVINMSLGGGERFSESCDSSNSAYAAAADAARNAEIIIFASSGNNGYTDGISSPACISLIVSVGAVYDADVGKRSGGCTDLTTQADKVACFSNTSPILDILAPGSTITAPYKGGGRSTLSGTSMASPHAAAVAALVLQKDPTLLPEYILSGLKSSGVSVNDERVDTSFPRINALALLASDIGTMKVGKNYPYTSIQAAIDAANSGKVILVHNGTYTENIDFKGKAVTVRSKNGPAFTIIDGNALGSVVVFNSGEGNNSVFTGFTVQNGLGNSGGGIYCSSSSPAISKCIIKGNTAGDGGGIYCENSSPILSNCVVSGNISGGGIYCENSSPTLSNCTISKNTNNGAGIYCSASSPTVINSIFWNNTVEISLNNISSINITYSNIQGGYTGKGNINEDPMFMDADNGNYNLMCGSSCIDVGDPDSTFPLDDMEGTLRPQPEGDRYDMGAYEYTEGNIYYQDKDGDGYGSSTNSLKVCLPPQGYVGNSTDCNDDNVNVNPGVSEICNGTDDNCDGQVDEGVQTTYYHDADGDGYGSSSNSTQACSLLIDYVNNNADCNDNSSLIYPGAAETCSDGIDSNCDGDEIICQNYPSIMPAPIMRIPTAGQPLTISANINDNGNIVNVFLYYRSEGSSGQYTSTPMMSIAGQNVSSVDEETKQWTATIPGANVTENGMEYYISADDNEGNTTIILTKRVNTNPADVPTLTEWGILLLFTAIILIPRQHRLSGEVV